MLSHRAALFDRGLAVPLVEVDVDRLERGLDVGEHLLAGPASGLGHVVGTVVLRGEIGDELARIAVLGNGLPVLPGEQARTEAPHLPAGVVDVVLARDLVSRALEAAGRARRRTTPNQPLPTCSGPVGFAETNSTIDPLAVAEIGLRVAIDARFDDVAQHLVQPCVAQAEVDEAGPGDLDRLDMRELRRVERRCELGRELARVATRGFGR